MHQSAWTLLVECMKAKKGEKVLIVTDKEKTSIGAALFQEASDKGVRQ